MTQPYIIVPARRGSTRLPHKPLQLLHGKPLILHVLNRLQALPDVHLYVATDDLEIHALITSAGGQALLTSPTCPSGLDRVAEAMSQLLPLIPEDNPLVLNVQGDEPFLPLSSLTTLCARMQAEPQLPMGTLVSPLTDPSAFYSPHVVKVVTDNSGRALYFSRAPIPFTRDDQGLPSQALQHIGVYAYRLRTLHQLASTPPHPLEELEKLEQLRALAHGISIQVVLTEAHPRGIDTPEDLARAEQLLQTKEFHA